MFLSWFWPCTWEMMSWLVPFGFMIPSLTMFAPAWKRWSATWGVIISENPEISVHIPHLGLVHDSDQPVADGHNDVPGPEAALVSGAVIVDCPQHQVQTILITRIDRVMRQSYGQRWTEISRLRSSIIWLEIFVLRANITFLLSSMQWSEG